MTALNHVPISNLDPKAVALGRKLKLIRKIRRCSLTELGEHLGISFHQLQRYERGVNQISATTLMAISDYFLVPFNYFSDQDVQLSKVVNFDFSGQEIEFFRRFKAIDDAILKQSIIKLVDGVVDKGGLQSQK